jgi:uncharacterized protein YndB with AHSA1/START domain
MTTSTLPLLLPITAILTAALAAACGPSLGALQARARAGHVQPGAPLHARQSIAIAAPRERVYALLTDFAGWPRWQPAVSSVSPPAVVAPGARFRWTHGGKVISAQLAAVEPGALIAWTGAVSIAKAIHVWRLSSPTPDTTRVDVEETMDGFLLTWVYSQRELDAEIGGSLARLRRAAEQPSPPAR